MSRSEIQSYHESCPPLNFNEGFQVKTKYKFSVGIEVEKDHFINEYGEIANDRGDYVGEYTLFSGFETDSSCGVEAITNILPLEGVRSERRHDIFSMFKEAKDIINSPHNNRCGGHMTISVETKGKKLSKYDIMDKLKHNLSIIYALYPARLSASHCCENKKILWQSNQKYSPVYLKHNRVEIRLFSAIKNVEQLKNRYDLLFKILYYTFEKPVSFSVLLKKVTPNLKRLYRNHPNKTQKINRVLDLSKSFRMYLIDGKESENIEQYI